MPGGFQQLAGAFEVLLRDLAYAARILIKNPGFSAVTVSRGTETSNPDFCPDKLFRHAKQRARLTCSQ
jgi:hypothetical protein